MGGPSAGLRPRHSVTGKTRIVASWKSLPAVTAGVILIGLALLSFTWVPDRDRDAHAHLLNSQQQHVQHQAPKTTVSSPKLLLATHSRLFWWHPSTNSITLLHEGQGVHYGVFPGAVSTDGELLSVWYVHRPHNWHPRTTEEALVEVDANTGDEVSRHRINARFTHDAVRSGDHVFICSTESGEIVQLQYPQMTEVKRMRLFTRKQHVNSLAPLSPTGLWVMLHNLGQSSMVHVDMTPGITPGVIGHIPQVGTKAHGVVRWGEWFIYLDSEGSGLARVKETEEQALLNGDLQLATSRAAKAPAQTEVIYTVPEGGKFLKGLCVIDDVAYFGISVWAKREARDDPDADSEVAAYHLVERRLLWRKKAPTRGLLNIIAAPHLSQASTYMAVTTAAATRGSAEQAGTSGQAAGGSSSHADEGATQTAGGIKVVGRQSVAASVEAVTKQLNDMGFPAVVGGRWASGHPYLDLKLKSSKKSWLAGIQLPITQVDVSGVQRALKSMPEQWWADDYQQVHNAAVSGRDDNMNKYKPGVGTIFMIFSDRGIRKTYRYPFYDRFKDVLEPIIKQIIGAQEMSKVVRLQFALMPPNSVIHMHRDMGGYALDAHRIHIPIFTTPDVSFQVCPGLEKRVEGKHQRVTDESITEPDDCVEIPMSEGMVFELNNRVLHRVTNKSPTQPRIQLVVDVAEHKKPVLTLKPGTQCKYVHGNVVCPVGSIDETA